MGVKKIVMLAILVSFVAGCAPLHPSNCHKTTALVVAVQDVGMIRMNGGASTGNQGCN